jgi:hypothetical protein
VRDEGSFNIFNIQMTHPSSMTQWSKITQPTIFTIFPIVQCFPITDFLMVVLSPTLVESPIKLSAEI